MSTPLLDDVAGWLRLLGDLGLPAGPGEDALTGAGAIDTITALEQLKRAATAAQGRIATTFADERRATDLAHGVPAAQAGSGAASEIALARRESLSKARTFLGLHRVLTTEMPHTARALAEGRIDEWTATLLARETACLQAEHRRTIDEKIAGGDLVDRSSTSELVAEAHRLACRLDNAGVAERQALAEKDRRVTIRSAPDTMCYVTLLSPVADGVAMFAALKGAADTARSTGDPRTRGQVMADTLVELATGRSTDTPPPVDLRLVMTDATLLRGDDEPAVLPGYGVLPADASRHLVRQALSKAAVWVTRLFTAPTTRQLMAVDSHRRQVPEGLKDFVRDRDHRCRVVWCGAPLRHVDHVEGFQHHPRSDAWLLQGLCEAHNYVKELPGWRSRVPGGPDGLVETTTPTGHVYLSFPPALPRPPE